jgi:DNA-binding transcriptional LysR family regulator
MRIGLRDIEYFGVVAEHRHVGRAAEALGLSQPALSRSLRRLEQSLDTTLLTRTPKGVELTVVGTAFLSHVQRLRLSLDDIEHEVQDLTKGRSGHLRVGANSHGAEHVLPAAIATLVNAAPKLKLNVTVGPTAALVAALRSGQLDLIISGIVAPTEPDLVQVHLWDDDYYVYASAEHRLAARKRLTIADVAAEGWALPQGAPPTLWLQRTFQDHGLAPPKLMLETSSLSLRLRVVASSKLLDFLPRISARSAPEGLRLAELRVKELAWRRPLVARYRRNAYLSPAAKLFIDVLNATAREISARRR